MESPALGSRGSARDGGRRLALLSSRRAASRWLGFLALFVLVTWSVELAWWSRLDNSVNDWAASHRTTMLWTPAKVVFDVVTPEIALPITLVFGLLVAWRRHQWGIAGEAAIRVGLVVASVLLLKPLLALPGPTRNPLGDHGGSFPSGHTTSTVVCMALVLAWIGRPRRATGRIAVNAAVVAIVAASVIYLNFHFLSDVAGGVVLGLVIATMPLPVLRSRRRTTPADPGHGAGALIGR